MCCSAAGVLGVFGERVIGCAFADVRCATVSWRLEQGRGRGVMALVQFADHRLRSVHRGVAWNGISSGSWGKLRLSSASTSTCPSR